MAEFMIVNMCTNISLYALKLFINRNKSFVFTMKNYYVFIEYEYD